MVLMKRKAGPIAIDFGTCTLRAMQLAGSGDQHEVIAAAQHTYPARGLTTEREQREVIEALQAVLREKRFVGRQTVSALGGRELLIKNIRLPEMPETELASAVRFEAQERIGDLDQDAEVRFIPAGRVSGDADPQQEVIVMAAPASAVRRHLELLSEAGLVSVGIDAAPCAIFRPFDRYLRRSEDQEQVNVFVDVGWAGTRLVIAKGSEIVFMWSIDVGGVLFDRLVASNLSLDLTQARELRRRIASVRSDNRERDPEIGSSTIDRVDTAVHPAWEKLGKEIGLCLRYYGVTFRGARPDTVTCVGGESLHAPYLQHLSEVTGLRCRVGSPLRNVKCAPALPVHETRGPMADWTTAVGLSMKPPASTIENVG
jgi:type IV pilus assembly protein PilM